MSKERLGEINHIYEYIKRANDEEDGNNVEQGLHEFLSEGHIDWLIEQAERVQELEESKQKIMQTADVIDERYQKLHEQNEMNYKDLFTNLKLSDIRILVDSARRLSSERIVQVELERALGQIDLTLKALEESE